MKALTKAHQMLQVGRRVLGLNTDQKIYLAVAPLILLARMVDSAREAVRSFPQEFNEAVRFLRNRRG